MINLDYTSINSQKSLFLTPSHTSWGAYVCICVIPFSSQQHWLSRTVLQFQPQVLEFKYCMEILNKEMYARTLFLRRQKSQSLHTLITSQSINNGIQSQILYQEAANFKVTWKKKIRNKVFKPEETKCLN